MRLTRVIAASSLGLATLALALTSLPARAETLAGAKLGQKIADVNFTDRSGKTVTLHDVAGKKGTVVLFLSFECPISTAYSPVLVDMAKHYSEQGVTFVGVCANEEETAQSVAKQAEEFKLNFPIFCDNQGTAVAAFKAEKTPEAFVLDHNLMLRYRGRIDDAYAARLKKNLQIKNHDLTNALDELLAGKAVSHPLAEAVGCPIGIEKKIKATGSVTYYRDVLPILQERCQECHRPNQVGPFSLMTFKQAVNWADDIKGYTASRTMPPWKISEGIPFQHDRRLSDKEMATIAKWVDEGTPEGDSHEAPPPRKFVDGWQLGKPDMIISTSEEFVLGPGGRDLFRVFVMPTNLPEDKFVVAYEMKPGNPRVVHHTLNFIDTTGQGRKIEKKAVETTEKAKKESDFDRGPGYSVAMGVGFFPQGGLGGWAPGQVPHQMPEGYGWLLPKGSDVVVQVHYHRNGRVERDRLQIGLYFAKQSKGMKAYKGGVIAGRFFGIPAGQSHYKITGSTTTHQECVLHSIMPHMHLLGQQIKVTMTPPDGKKQTLLAINSWDYNWQETYFLEHPMKLKPGTEFEVEAIYNNSDSNPNNPNSPPKFVTFGEQTTNEMCFVFLGATSDGPGRSPFAKPFGRGGDRERNPSDKKAPGSDKGPTTEKRAKPEKSPTTDKDSVDKGRAVSQK